MDHIETIEEPGAASGYDPDTARRRRIWLGAGIAIAVLVAAGEFGPRLFAPAAPPAPPPPAVGVSQPLQREIDRKLSFLGQFAAIKSVEIRAQVGGTLTAVNFKDGDVVRQGQLLFQIDPVPYQIKVDQAKAELEAANARLALASREFVRAQALKATDAGSQENVDQKLAEKASAVAAVDGAKATLHDALFDLGKTRVYAPFTGRVGTHLVSAGNLIAGSRAASSPTTLLTTLVSLDPIWLNFDMSEQDYMTFQSLRAQTKGPLANKVEVALSDGDALTRQGTLDFVDNAIDRSSGTIHARATLQNGDALLTPGGFGRVRLAVSTPAPALLVPDAAVMSDQGDHSVFVVGKDNVVASKKVTTGDLRGGLRVITSGLSATDKVIVDGIPSVKAGAPITPQAGAIRFDSTQD
ncbi:efflux transporter periplasmic adaptor subunit [Nostoc sp. 3335mG]|nr:efflux transporter periplasmic adaptor subunit [Nostoc sp. 3335mG]